MFLAPHPVSLCGPVRKCSMCGGTLTTFKNNSCRSAVFACVSWFISTSGSRNPLISSKRCASRIEPHRSRCHWLLPPSFSSLALRPRRRPSFCLPRRGHRTWGRMRLFWRVVTWRILWSTSLLQNRKARYHGLDGPKCDMRPALVSSAWSVAQRRLVRGLRKRRPTRKPTQSMFNFTWCSWSEYLLRSVCVAAPNASIANAKTRHARHHCLRDPGPERSFFWKSPVGMSTHAENFCTHPSVASTPKSTWKLAPLRGRNRSAPRPRPPRIPPAPRLVVGVLPLLDDPEWLHQGVSPWPKTHASLTRKPRNLRQAVPPWQHQVFQTPLRPARLAVLHSTLFRLQ